jgi:hypothetical protein
VLIDNPGMRELQLWAGGDAQNGALALELLPEPR